MRLPHAPSGDPLLTATTLLLYLIASLLIIGFGAVLIALPALSIFWDQAVTEILKERPEAQISGLLPAISGALALALGVIGLAFQFVRKLLQIIRTVGEGDPFVTANASRLEHMAWYTLAIQLIGIVMGGFVYTISQAVKDSELHYGFGFESLITALLLFILARVFRRGAEMRSDLEGTV
jgi:hypothetical protein